MLSLFAVFALLMDYYIYRRHLPALRWLRVIYAIQALLLDVGVLIYLVCNFFYGVNIAHTVVLSLMWVILIFLMSIGVKVTFTLFSLIGLAVKRISVRGERVFVRIGGVAVILIISAGLYGSLYERNHIRVEHVTITSDRLPDSFDGFTVAQFSDVHLGNLRLNSPLVSELVERVNALNPDMVVSTGDLVNIESSELNPSYMDILSGFNAPVYSVLGNHDMAYYIRDKSINPLLSISDLIGRQRSMGWQMLENENVIIRRGGDSIAVCGVIYPQDNRLGVRNNGYGGSDLVKSFNGVDSSAFAILLSHSPALFDSLPPMDLHPAITMSGHVHAMQVKISLGDWQWSPASWLFPLWSGLYYDRGRALYINDGLGYVLYPFRLGTQPEITLYTFKKQS